MNSMKKSLVERINDIELEDLQYVETDLCFYELVSLGFLLYGDNRTRCQFMLQRLIILSQHPPQGKGLQKKEQLLTSDILRNYAKANPAAWRPHVVEALAIIKAKRVLRKLGLPWLELYQQYLPHIAEISVNIHPLLKALYVIAERLTPQQAGKFINDINSKCHNSQDLRFYDFGYLEIFILNWLTKSVIKLGDRQLKDCNVDILIEYFKFNDMDGIKDILLETINQNSDTIEHASGSKEDCDNVETQAISLKDSGVSLSQEMEGSISSAENAGYIKPIVQQQQKPQEEDFDSSLERYMISRENAGYVLIINQSNFYKETDPKLKHLIPDMSDAITKRRGTDIDRDKLTNLYTSFGYIPLIFENLTHFEILHHIRETVKKSLLKDSIIICILSHGMEGVVFGCNTIPVAINEIKEILTADTLKGKPKLLIIQACQKHLPTIDTRVTNSITDFSPEAYADILLAMSSIPGTDALRHTEYGSWFVDSLYKFTKRYGESKHMLDILTAVTRDISKRKGDANQAMLPSTSSTMRKEFYLPSKK